MNPIKKVGIAIALTTAILMGVNAQSVSGDWKGTLSVQGVSLDLIFHLAEENGIYSGSMDVPMQGATGIPVDKVETDGKSVKLGISVAQIVFNGTLQGDSIVGNYEQAGMTLPLTLKKIESSLPGIAALVSSEEELQALKLSDKGEYNYKVEDYFTKPKASSFQLSPDGNYLSYMEKDGLKNHVYIKEIATGKVTRAIEEKKEPVKGYGWVNDNRLIYVMDNGAMKTTIFAVDIDGSNQMDLTPFEGVRQ